MLWEVLHFSKFYNYVITDIFTIFPNFANSIGHIVGVEKTYPHAKSEVNISIQYQVMGKIGFNHISQSVGHLKSDDLQKQLSFSFLGT